jgi:curli biogenesis system outer membrane secretion channel CsgG
MASSATPGLLLFAVLVLGGCASVAKVEATMPAKVPEAASYRRVAVYPFEGRSGEIYRSEIEALLSGITVKQRRYFTVVERSRLDSVLNEQRRAGSALFDEQSAAEIGKLTGTEAIYMGSVTGENIDDQRYTKSVRRCSAYDNNGKCITWRTDSIPCTNRTATISFTVKLVEVTQGTIPYAKTLTGRSTSSACRGDGRKLDSRANLFRIARQLAYIDLRRDVAPYPVTMKITLLDDTDGIETEFARSRLSSGIEFARADRLDRACELWLEARGQAPDSVSILYNLGVCAEATGNLKDARNLYRQADRLLSKPNKTINEALDRIDRRINSAPKTSEGRRLNPGFRFAASRLRMLRMPGWPG